MTSRHLYMVLTLCIFLVSIFLFIKEAQSAELSVVITEIGAHEVTNHEWIEIQNIGSAPVDLANWTFWEENTNHRFTLKQGTDTVLLPGEYAIITQNDVNFIADYPSVDAKIFDSSWGTLKETGEEIGLKDATGSFVEHFVYSEAKNSSLEKKDPLFADYTLNNWAEHPDGNTVGEENYWTTHESAEDSDHEEHLNTQKPATSTHQTASVIINEFVSHPHNEEKEWIELYNTGDTSTDLSGWTLSDGIGVVATLTSPIPAHEYLVVELASNKLNNSGDVVILKDASAAVIDKIAFGSWDDGGVGDNVAASAQGTSLSRVGDAFVETSPSKGVVNLQPQIPQTTTSTRQLPKSSPRRPYQASDIVINEFVSDPADNENEFVELYNRSGRTISLFGWWLEDGSETKTELSGDVAHENFFLIEKPKGNLNNGGDQLALFEPGGLMIDQVAYGAWDDGKTRDNALVAKDPYSVGRRTDGHDTDTDSFDFIVFDQITPGAPNIFSQSTSKATPLEHSLIISELLPNPSGSDSKEEFIEIHYLSGEPLQLHGWALSDSTSGRYTLSDVVIQAGEYLVLSRSTTGIALNNTGGDTINLLDAGGNVVDSVTYKDTALEDHAYARDKQGRWTWSARVTKGKENSIQHPNNAPIAVIDAEKEVAAGEIIVLDASDSTDTDGGILLFSWDFGDGEKAEGLLVQHAYAKPGAYTVGLTVTDAGGSIAKTDAQIVVKLTSQFAGGPPTDVDILPTITEIFPNPEGVDDEEFVEFYNPTDQTMDLSGFFLDDGDGGSRPYKFAQGTMIAAYSYRVFWKEETRLVLNNTTDMVRLLYSDTSAAFEVEYDGVQEAASYAKNGQEQWVWTEVPTPGLENRIMRTKLTSSASTKNRNKNVRSTSVIQETTLAHVREFDSGDLVRVEGIVTVPPDVIGSQVFYIGGTGGVQVYMYAKDFPKMTVGDRVAVIGGVSEAFGETRIKVSKKEDISVSAQSGEVLVPAYLDIVDVSEIHEGELISISGEITEKKSSYFYLDDGTAETRVYLKKGTGISSKDYRVGSAATVVGIVGQKQDEYYILPRFSSDIQITKDDVGQIVSGGGLNTEEDVTQSYLTTTAAGLTSILITLAVRARGVLAAAWMKNAFQGAIRLVRR